MSPHIASRLKWPAPGPRGPYTVSPFKWETDDDKPNRLLVLEVLGAIHSRTNPVQVGFDKKLKTSTGSLNVARPPGPPVKILDLDLNEINPTEKYK